MRAEYYFENVESTMLEYERIRGITPGLSHVTVRAGAQSSGLGRSGHHWHSPQGGLWFTFDLYHPQATQSFALFAGSCLHRLLNELYDIPDLKIKWTNDLYYKNQKLAGILCRYQMIERYYVIGIGINTNNVEDADARLYNGVKLANIIGDGISNQHLMQLYIQKVNDLAHELTNPQIYLDYCNRHLYGKDCWARIDLGSDMVCGTIDSIDADGSLILLTPEKMNITFGSVISIDTGH